MIACASLAWRSNRSRATFSTASRMTLNSKIDAGIPTANTIQGSTVQWRARRVAWSVAVVIASLLARLENSRLEYPALPPNFRAIIQQDSQFLALLFFLP